MNLKRSIVLAITMGLCASIGLPAQDNQVKQEANGGAKACISF